MRVRTCVVLLFALFVAVPAMAQEQRGAIEGIVKDTSGAVLPGATVEARRTGVVLNTVSDATGRFASRRSCRAPTRSAATLQGFTTAKSAMSSSGLGQVKKVDLALALASVAETCDGHGRIAAGRRAQSARRPTSAPTDRAAAPRPRLHHACVPGAGREHGNEVRRPDPIDGASAAENRYIIDGIETTDLRHRLCKSHCSRLPRRGPGQVERLPRRVRRRDRRRDQRHHQEREQQVQRLTAHLLSGK